MNRCCFIPGCSTGYPETCRINKSKGLKNASLFKAKGEAQLQKWRRVIPRKDRIFSERDVVCEKHFPMDDVSRYYETKMPDGSINRIERGYPSLSSDAVPSIFPNLPKYLTKVVKKRKPPMKRNVNVDLRSVRPPSPDVRRIDDFHNLEILADVAASINTSEPVLDIEGSNTSGPVMDVEDICTVDTGTLKGIELPGPNWASAFVGKNLIFASFGNDLMLEKTLAVTEDLEVKVILNRKFVSVDGLRTIKDEKDLLDAIALIDKLVLCKGIPGAESSFISTHNMFV